MNSVSNAHMQSAIELARYQRQQDCVFALAMAAARLAGEVPNSADNELVTVYQAARNVVQEGFGGSRENDVERLRAQLHVRGFTVEMADLVPH